MAAEEAKDVAPDTKVYCKTCKITFKEWDAYHNHKMTSKQHICCDICSTDFHTDEGLKRHRTSMHPKEQKLSCLGCGKIYIRLGSLIAHLELDSCYAINSEVRENLATRRRQRQKLHSKFKEGLKHIDENAGPRTGISLLDSQDIPINATYSDINRRLPPTFEAKMSTNVDFGGWETTILEEDEPLGKLNDMVLNSVPEPVMELQPEEDLISFTEIDKAMSIPWGGSSKKAAKKTANPTEEVKYECAENGFPIPIAPSMKESNFPPLPGGNNFKDAGMKAPNFMDAPVEDSKFTSIWDTKHIIANARKPVPPPPKVASLGNPSVTPPVTDVAARAGGLPPLRMRALVNPLPEKEYAPHDPEDPAFRAQRYWVPFTKSTSALTGCAGRAPILNQASSDICFLLRMLEITDLPVLTATPFGTYTALTQHCESQGVRCKIREADNYDKVVDDITASVADVIGRHEDETVRYTVNKEGWGDLEALTRKYRKNEEKNSKNRANYWKDHEKEFEW